MRKKPDGFLHAFSFSRTCWRYRTAVQMYPAMSNLIDEGNVYHLWVLPEAYELPFGLHFDGGCGFVC